MEFIRWRLWDFEDEEGDEDDERRDGGVASNFLSPFAIR